MGSTSIDSCSTSKPAVCMKASVHHIELGVQLDLQRSTMALTSTDTISEDFQHMGIA